MFYCFGFKNAISSPLTLGDHRWMRWFLRTQAKDLHCGREKWKLPFLFVLFLKSSKMIVNSDCSHEIKRCLLLGRKAMISLDSIVKSRNITFPTKVPIVKAMVFSVVMYGLESWAVRRLSTEELMLLSCGVGEVS